MTEDIIGDTHKCDQCPNSTTELFHCETCNHSRDENPSEKELLCDICIAPHLQRGHVISDKKGHVPLTCTGHKMLQQEYCLTCDVTFCWKCMSKHSEHKFDTLEKRGSELRGEVFEILSELEKKEKPMRAKKEKLSMVIEKHKKEQLTLRQLVEKEIDKLRQNCSSVIEENCELFVSDLEKIVQLVDETVDLQKQLRDLLASSNAHLLKQFSSTQKHVSDNNAVHEELIRKDELRAVTCETEKLLAMFDHFGKDFGTFLKSRSKLATFQRTFDSKRCRSLNEFYFIRFNQKIIKIGVEDNQLIISRAINTLQFSVMRKLDFNDKIERCFALSDWSERPEIVLIVTATNKFFLCDVEKDSKLQSVTPPTHKHLLCPYYVIPFGIVSNKIQWSYWDEEAKLIKFTHNNHFTIKCDQLPTVRRNDMYNIDSLMFITADNNVIYADALNKMSWIIPVGNSSGEISSTTKYEDMILIWCCEDESVLISTRKKVDESTPPVKYKLNTESLYTHIEVNGRKCKLLPAFRNQEGEYIYLFSIQIDNNYSDSDRDSDSISDNEEAD